MIKKDKITELKAKLKEYEEKLAREMIGYRGVVHESAMSELKHSKVMVLRAMVEGLRVEVEKLKAED